MVPTKRNIKIDLLKALAIFSVVLYHIGLLKFGYLGVEIFLVVNGFLIGKTIKKEESNNSFSFLKFIIKKVEQFLPLLLIAGSVSLLIGYFYMLPDDYENLSESIIATNFFANNILAGITVKNYWDIWNDFKPMMHTWYIGILIQSYFVIGIVPKISKIFSKRNKRASKHIYMILFIISLVLYFLPCFKNYMKFYFIPFRLFELLLGTILAYNIDSIIKFVKNVNKKIIIEVIAVIMVICLLFIPYSLYSNIRLVFVCLATAILLVFSSIKDINRNHLINVIAYFGRISYSIFIWHQIVIAFIRYSIKVNFSIFDYIIIFLIIMSISIVSHKYIEEYVRKVKPKNLRIFNIVLFLITSVFALLIYNNAGVVRDVPELNIYKNSVKKNMHSEYCDRGYLYDKNFDVNDKTNILVIGDSYGRDWINIVLESKIAKEVNVSYIYRDDLKIEKKLSDRIDKANFVFYSISKNNFEDLPSYLEKYYKAGKVYIVGNKSFGNSNGIIYSKRNEKDYFKQTIILDDSYYIQNRKLKKVYGKKYIDMIGYVSEDNNRIRVFTNTNKFISQDTRHLTKSGAIYYASLIDWNEILANN